VISSDQAVEMEKRGEIRLLSACKDRFEYQRQEQ
jgi:hypothetical protein